MLNNTVNFTVLIFGIYCESENLINTNRQVMINYFTWKMQSYFLSHFFWSYIFGVNNWREGVVWIWKNDWSVNRRPLLEPWMTLWAKCARKPFPTWNTFPWTISSVVSPTQSKEFFLTRTSWGQNHINHQPPESIVKIRIRDVEFICPSFGMILSLSGVKVQTKIDIELR